MKLPWSKQSVTHTWNSSRALERPSLRWFEAHYSSLKQIHDPDTHRNENVRCETTVFSEGFLIMWEDRGVRHRRSTAHNTPGTLRSRPLNVFFSNSWESRRRWWTGAWRWHHTRTVVALSGASVRPRFAAARVHPQVQSLLLPLPSAAGAHVMICGSQDWPAAWGRHWVMTKGPMGLWLSRQRPLTRCCRTEPLGFHFCGGGKRKETVSFHSLLINEAHDGGSGTVMKGWPMETEPRQLQHSKLYTAAVER